MHADPLFISHLSSFSADVHVFRTVAVERFPVRKVVSSRMRAHSRGRGWGQLQRFAIKQTAKLPAALCTSSPRMRRPPVRSAAVAEPPTQNVAVRGRGSSSKGAWGRLHTSCGPGRCRSEHTADSFSANAVNSSRPTRGEGEGAEPL